MTKYQKEVAVGVGWLFGALIGASLAAVTVTIIEGVMIWVIFKYLIGLTLTIPQCLGISMLANFAAWKVRPDGYDRKNAE